MRLKLELDQETSDALNRAAERELRLPGSASRGTATEGTRVADAPA
jgi:hypothetical protein